MSRGVFGFGWRVEVSGRGHDRGALLARDAHRRHVAVEELAEVDARIVATRHEVAARVVFAGDVEHDVRVGARERRQFRTQQRRQHNRRRDQTDEAGRPLAELTNVEQRRVDISQSGTERGKKPLARLRHRDRPRRPCQEANAQALLEGLHCVTHRRAADAEPDCGLGEAAILGDDGEHREGAQFLTGDW